MKYAAVLLVGLALGWLASAELGTGRYQLQGNTRLDTRTGDIAVRRETARVVQRRLREPRWTSDGWVRGEVVSWWAVAVWAALPALLGYVGIPGGAMRQEAPRNG